MPCPRHDGLCDCFDRMDSELMAIRAQGDMLMEINTKFTHEIDHLRFLLRELSYSGAEPTDERLPYLNIQVDKQLWNDIIMEVNKL